MTPPTNASIKALIIDDEPSARELLREMLGRFCTDVDVLGEAQDAEQALERIQQTGPNLLLLDLQMPEHTGFELLDMLPNAKEYMVIFITAYDQHALQAFKHQAVDYLVKPIDPGDLIRAIDRVREVMAGRTVAGSPPPEINDDGGAGQRLRVPTPSGFQFLYYNEIEAVAANRAYSELILRTGEEIMVSQSLSALIEQLDKPPFIQVHRSHAVNITAVRAYDRSHGHDLITYSDRRYQIARSRLESVLQALEQWG